MKIKESAKLLAQLRRLGYNVVFDSNNPMLVYSWNKKTKTNITKVVILGLDISELPYCCGIMEIGNCNVFHNNGEFEARDDSEEIIKLAFKYIVMKFYDEHTRHVLPREKPKTFKPIMFTTNEGKWASFVAEAIVELPKYFKEISVSINPNTYSKLTTYISY